MPRSFFSRVVLQNVVVLLTFLVIGGVLVDNFLSRSEMNRLGDQIERFALILKEEAGRAGEGGDLQALVKTLESSTKVRFTVIDKSGKVLADSLLDPATMENHSSHPEVAAALAGREGRNLRKSASLGIEMLYVAIPGDPVVRAAVPVSEVDSVIGDVQERVFLAVIPATLVALLLAYLLAKSLNSRVERMRVFSTSLEKGDYAQALRAEGDDELSDMERSLLALRDEIKNKVEYLKRDARVLSGLIEGFPHSVLLFDENLELLLVNAPARSLFNVNAADAVGLGAGKVVRIPKILEALEAVVQKNLPVEPFRLMWVDGQRQFEVLASPLIGTKPEEVVLILRDITNEMRLERVRSDFIVNLSHELRTPLTAIRGSAETLLSAQNCDPAQVNKFLETIKRNSLRLENLLRDVADLARAESAVEAGQVRTFDAAAPLKNAVDLFAGEAEKAGVNLVLGLPAVGVTITSDEEKIEQIMINLMQNAVRYTPAGGSVKVGVSLDGNHAVYRVQDTGIGIPEADLGRITERFYRVDPGRSRAVGGTGLGLSIVKHLVEGLKGELTIQSRVGQGTTVTVRLPRV